VDAATWEADVALSFAWSMCWNLVLVDAAKVACLCFTSPPALLALCGVRPADEDSEKHAKPGGRARKSRWSWREVAPKVLRRLHKLLDLAA
jgi:hypothetical protein